MLISRVEKYAGRISSMSIEISLEIASHILEMAGQIWILRLWKIQARSPRLQHTWTPSRSLGM